LALNEEKRMAQIISAKRSLVTNLICMLVIILGSIHLYFMPFHISKYWANIAFALVKGFMPLLSTLANFGTVKSVFLQYKEHFYQLRLVSIVCKIFHLY